MDINNIECIGTRKISGCDWKGSISECKRIRDSDFGWWQYTWHCPKCQSTVATLNNNSPLNHPLQNECGITPQQSE